MRKPFSLLVPALLGAALLLVAWEQRHDPLDLEVIGAGLVGVALLVPGLRAGQGGARLAVRLLVALVAGVALFGERDPGSALGFALVLAVVGLVLGGLPRGR